MADRMWISSCNAGAAVASASSSTGSCQLISVLRLWPGIRVVDCIRLEELVRPSEVADLALVLAAVASEGLREALNLDGSLVSTRVGTLPDEYVRGESVVEGERLLVAETRCGVDSEYGRLCEGVCKESCGRMRGELSEGVREYVREDAREGVCNE